MTTEIIKAYLIYATPMVIALLPLFFLLAFNLSDEVMRKIETRFPRFGMYLVEVMLLIMIAFQLGLLISPFCFMVKLSQQRRRLQDHWGVILNCGCWADV